MRGKLHINLCYVYLGDQIETLKLKVILSLINDTDPHIKIFHFIKSRSWGIDQIYINFRFDTFACVSYENIEVFPRSYILPDKLKTLAR